MSTPSKAEKPPTDQAMLAADDTQPETLDGILRTIGQFGRVQKVNMALCLFVGVTVGFQNVCPVFTLRTPRHRCRLPDLVNDTYTPHDPEHTRAVEAFIPLDGDGNYEKCKVWKYDVNGTSRQEEACDSWVYDVDVFDNTLATDLDLVCDKKIIRSTSSMLIFAGKFFGAIFQGLLSDRFGRRPTIFFWATVMLACCIGNGLVNSVPLLFVFRFFTGMGTTATYLLIYVLTIELLHPANRTLASTALRFNFAMGQLALALFASLVTDWRTFQLILIWPAAMLIIGLGFVTESPRWLLSKNRNEAARSVLRRIAQRNKMDLPESRLANLRMPAESQKRDSAINLFRVPRLALHWCILYINWVVITAVYYGLTLNVSNMKGDLIVNFVLVTSVDVVSTVTTGLVVNRLSRKYFHIVIMITSGLVLALSVIPVVTHGPEWVPIAMSMVGKFTISCAFFIIYTYSAELFPTTHRSFGMGSCSMVGRLGGLAAPYVADLSLFVGGAFGQALPQLVCGVAGVIGGVAALVLPETRGRPLPETIEDAKKAAYRKGSDANVEVDGVKETAGERRPASLEANGQSGTATKF